MFTASSEAVERIAASDGKISGMLSTVQATLEHILRHPLEQGPLISGRADVEAYLRISLVHAPVEEVRVLYLDVKNILLREELVSRGTLDGATIYPRSIVKRALELDAAGLILVHNHPSGDPDPSRADRTLTVKLVQAAQALDIRVHDHLIVARTGVFSFQEAGLL